MWLGLSYVSLCLLDWIISYLQETRQQVVIGCQSSSTTTLRTCVPQDPVLAYLLILVYLQIIDDIIRAHGLFFNLYADDLQGTIRFLFLFTIELHNISSSLLFLTNNKTYLDLVPPVPFRISGDELSPSGTIIRNCFGIIPFYFHF